MSVYALLCPRCVRREGSDFLVRNLKCHIGREARARVRARLVGSAGSAEFEPGGRVEVAQLFLGAMLGRCASDYKFTVGAVLNARLDLVGCA